MTAPRWTVVQHSGVTTGHSEFAAGLESKRVPYRRDQEAIVRAGGKLFDDYATAERYAEAEQWRITDGMIPRAPGTFAGNVRVDGLPVYVPPVFEHRFVVTVSGCTDEQAEQVMRLLIKDGPREAVAGGQLIRYETGWGWESCT